jgi:hypothetical protein
VDEDASHKLEGIDEDVLVDFLSGLRTFAKDNGYVQASRAASRCVRKSSLSEA